MDEESAVRAKKEMSKQYAKIIKVTLRVPDSSRVDSGPVEAEVAADSAGEDEVPVTESVTVSTAKSETADRKLETGSQEPEIAGQEIATAVLPTENTSSAVLTPEQIEQICLAKGIKRKPPSKKIKAELKKKKVSESQADPQEDKTLKHCWYDSHTLTIKKQT